MLSKEDYEDALYGQYVSAKGFLGVSKSDKYIREDLKEYFEGMKYERRHYLELLRTLGVNYNEETTIEVGKGNLDSAVEIYNASIVTPYVGLFEGRRAPVYEGSYKIVDDDIVMGTGPLPIPQGRIYITHNMYNPSCIRGWINLVKNNDIVIGVYGREEDKDKDYKIGHVENIASLLDNGTYNHGTIDGYYFAAVRAEQDKKVLVKTLGRMRNNGRVR